MGKQSRRTELLTCKIWCYLWVESVRIELNHKTSSWCWRIAWCIKHTHTQELSTELQHLIGVGGSWNGGRAGEMLIWAVSGSGETLLQVIQTRGGGFLWRRQTRVPSRNTSLKERAAIHPGHLRKAHLCTAREAAGCDLYFHPDFTPGALSPWEAGQCLQLQPQSVWQQENTWLVWGRCPCGASAFDRPSWNVVMSGQCVGTHCLHWHNSCVCPTLRNGANSDPEMILHEALSFGGRQSWGLERF